MGIKNRLRELRARYGMTQEELAKRVARVFGLKIEDVFIYEEDDP